MNIIIINKEIFQNRPPVISTLLSLSDLGHNVTLVSVNINDYWRDELKKRHVDFYIIPDRKKRNKIAKVFEYLNFKNKTLTFLNRVVKDKNKTLLWIIGGSTVFCLDKSLKKYRFVLQLQELYEENASYKRVFKRVINNADAVFVNEYNRSVLYQCWYNMKKRPYVLPNKPYFIDTNTFYDLSSYMDVVILKNIKTSKVILFQGQIVSYRDLTPYIKAAKEMGGYQIVLLGNEYGMVEKYRKIDDRLIYINKIPAPQYLGVTALSHICLITYDPHSLNNSYCAPNKIFEYGAYGKPMIGNDIPGLKVIEEYHAGILVDEGNIESVKEALKKIECDYKAYSDGAKALFNSVDNNSTIAAVIDTMEQEAYCFNKA